VTVETATPRGFDEGALGSLPPSSPYVADLRAAAFEEFRALPVPSQETEEWRYTDLSDLGLDLVPFAQGGRAGNLDDVPDAVLGAAGNVGDRAGLQIQRNSEVMLTQLSPELAARGVILVDLDRAAIEHPDLVERHLNDLVPTKRTKFTALHGAFRTGGTFLYVPRGVAIEIPLQTLTYVDVDGLAVFPHTLIVAEEDSEVTFIDRFASPDLPRALAVPIAEIHVGPAARVRYASIQEWGEGVTHLGIQRARLDRDSDLRALSVGFGASLSRAETECELAGRGASSEMLGVFFADGTQHFDHRSEQEHVAPDCTSDLLYKGALRDESVGVYSGWVHVRPGAQKTDAMQTSRNIILSEGAFGRAIPNLEIEANDVRCGHAASVGPVDEQELFYLQTRGIPAEEAERLIVTGFFQEVLDRITLDEVREGARSAIDAELAGRVR
jgi:Fe-S cluster assembly protein SufD